MYSYNMNIARCLHLLFPRTLDDRTRRDGGGSSDDGGVKLLYWVSELMQMGHTEECAVLVSPAGGSRVKQQPPLPEIHVGDAEEDRLVANECAIDIVPPGSPIQQPAPDKPAVAEMEIECAICLLPIIEPAKFPAKGCTHVYCVTCLAQMQAHTPTKPIICPQCRRWGPRPIPPTRPPPPPVTKARKARIMFCMFIGLLLCFAALAYDIGLFGVPFYGTVVDRPLGTPPGSRHNGDTLQQNIRTG